VHRDAGGVDHVADRQEVGHLERDTAERGDGDVDVEHVVELERLAVLQERLEHGHLDAFRPNLVVGMADVAEIRHAGFLEVQQVPAVVDDPHRVGLGEAHPDAMREGVVRGDQGRLN
jgi:hypothetical protein